MHLFITFNHNIHNSNNIQHCLVQFCCYYNNHYNHHHSQVLTEQQVLLYTQRTRGATVPAAGWNAAVVLLRCACVALSDAAYCV